MPEAAFALSAFGDEIAKDLSDQLILLKELDIHHLDLRSAWGKGLLEMTDADVEQVRGTCSASEMDVACLGSPVGKSPLEGPIEDELSKLARVCEIGRALDCRRVRMFSFYLPDPETTLDFDRYLNTAVSRLARLVELAEKEDALLLLENEKKLVGDTIERCHVLLSRLRSPHLRFLWDPANFVQVEAAGPTERGWPLLGQYVSYVHIKDADGEDGSVCVAGEGDGQIGALLTRLREEGYRGFLSLEPHLVAAGHSGGFSGATEMTHAVSALRRVMAETGCVEVDRIP